MTRKCLQLGHYRQNLPTTLKSYINFLVSLDTIEVTCKSFFHHAKCLYDLLSTDVTPVPHSKLNCQSTPPPPNQKIVWTDTHQKVLDYLVDILTNPPVMAFLRFEDLFILHIDAAEEGLGGILYQRQEGKLRVIGYGS